MKTIVLTVICLSYLSYTATAQQDPLYAQYINNPLVINPAYTGINNVFSASLSYRSQWAGFDGAPSTTSLSAHSSFFENAVGLGMIFVRDELGSTTNTQFSVTGAYKIDLGQAAFSYGMQAGIVSSKENNDALNVLDVNDPLFTGDQSFSKFNIGAGIALKSTKYYLGFSIPRLINNKEDFGNITTQLYQRHYYFLGAYLINISPDFAFKPAILLKGLANAPASLDLNLNAIIKDKFTVGLLTRNLDTYGLLAQVLFDNNLRIGYVAEIPTNNSVGSQHTSHEVSITMDLEIFDVHFLDQRHF